MGTVYLLCNLLPWYGLCINQAGTPTSSGLRYSENCETLTVYGALVYARITFEMLRHAVDGSLMWVNLFVRTDHNRVGGFAVVNPYSDECQSASLV